MNRFLMAVMAFFAIAVLVPNAAYAQAAPAPAPTTPEDGSFASFFGSKDKQDAKTYEAWKAYFQEDGMSCWGCRLFGAMGVATEEMGRKGVATFAPAAKKSVAAFMGLWVIWQLYLMLSVSHANSPAQSIDTIFQRLVIMMVVLWLLGNENVYSFILQPFLSTLAAVMQSAASLMGGGSGQCQYVNVGPEYVRQGNQLLCGMQRELNGGLALGAWMMDSANFNPFQGSIDFLQFVAGLVIAAVFAYMLIILPFRFFDALVRIATVAAVLPIAVLAYLFKPTRGVVKQAATSLLAAMLTFLFTAIAIALAVNVLNQITPGIYGQKFDSVETSWFGAVSGADFMMLLTAALGMASMISNAGNLAAEFAGFQGQMGSAGGAGSAVVGGAVGLAAKTAGGGVGVAAASRGISSSVARGVTKAGRAEESK